MSNLSDFGERSFINYVLRSQPRPADTYYLGLSTTPFDEGDSAGAAFAREPSGNGYSRTAITFGSASNRSISNSAPITFPMATGTWGTIIYWGIFDGASSSANLVAQGTLTGSVPVDNGVTFFIATGDLDITISNVWALNWGNWILNGFFNTTSTNFAYSSSFYLQNGFYLSTNSGIPASARYLQPSGGVYLAVSTTPFDLERSTTVLENGKKRTSQFEGSDGSFLTNVSFDSVNFSKEPWSLFPSGQTWFRDGIGTNGQQDLNQVVNTTARNLGYARQPLALGSASTAGGVTTIKNSSAIQFPPALSGWGEIGYWAIYQTNDFSYAAAVGASNGLIDPSSHLEAFTDLYPIMGGSFSQASTVGAGDILRINAGDFVITPQ